MARRIQSHDICRSREKGAVLIEFALVLSLFLLLILGGFDMLSVMSAKSNVNWIAQTLATCAKNNNNNGCPGATAKSLALGFSMDSKNISQAGINPITVTYKWTPISPWFPSGKQTLTSTATAP